MVTLTNNKESTLNSLCNNVKEQGKSIIYITKEKQHINTDGFSPRVNKYAVAEIF